MLGKPEPRPGRVACSSCVATLIDLLSFVACAVKVFYSLSSARLNQSTSAPQPAPIDPAFLATLDPSLAPSPAASTSQAYDQQPAFSSCIARLQAPVFVQLLGAPPTRPGATEFGKLTLKTCLSAICISRLADCLGANKRA